MCVCVWAKAKVMEGCCIYNMFKGLEGGGGGGGRPMFAGVPNNNLEVTICILRSSEPLIFPTKPSPLCQEGGGTYPLLICTNSKMYLKREVSSSLAEGEVRWWLSLASRLIPSLLSWYTWMNCSLGGGVACFFSSTMVAENKNLS